MSECKRLQNRHIESMRKMTSVVLVADVQTSSSGCRCIIGLKIIFTLQDKVISDINKTYLTKLKEDRYDITKGACKHEGAKVYEGRREKSP